MESQEEVGGQGHSKAQDVEAAVVGGGGVVGHSRGVRRGGRVGSGRVTKRDVEIVGWVGRCGVVDAAAVMRRFGVGRSQAYLRLGVLEREGLVRREALVWGGGSVWLATRKGLRAAESALAPAKASPGGLRHELAVAGVVAALEASGALVLAERELRAAQRDRDKAEGQVAWCCQVHTPQARRSAWHWPDLVLELDPGQAPEGSFIAVEVELTQKESRRLKAILDGWRTHHGQGLLGVLYLTPNQASTKRLQRITQPQPWGRWPMLSTSTLPLDAPRLLEHLHEQIAERRQQDHHDTQERQRAQELREQQERQALQHAEQRRERVFWALRQAEIDWQHHIRQRAKPWQRPGEHYPGERQTWIQDRQEQLLHNTP